MSFTVEPSTIINGLVGSLLLIVGVLIKMELHDIKSRITKLENVFIVSNNE